MLNACILLKVIPTKAEAVLEAIRKVEGVRKAYLTYGRFDIVAFLEAEDYAKLRKATTVINSIEGVRSTETLVEA
ncbi:MAG: Lrp/AsnC ligand binding domain-containing protein [Candidatus Bathyarchaeia archaeon]|nr:Lrp/AsnC ligand binding domain-containing protein [Candidatus Bathyarchaeota archaeon]